MISVAEALDRLFALVPVMETERVGLSQAHGRILAEPVVAARDNPSFDASAMDGYAVRSSEAGDGAVLDVVGEAAAGHRFSGTMPPGSAVRIFTGAPLPAESDSVLIQENARRDGNRIIVTEAPSSGAHIRAAGNDFTAGSRIESPRRISPRDVALFAAMNVPEVTVARRPVVALIPTGDELVHPGEAPGPDQIITSNNLGLAAMLTQIGAVPRLCPIARDNRSSLLQALDVAKGSDFVVTLGGASVGEHDIVAEVYGDAGLSLDFYRIAMRPGKPLMAGRLGDAVMIGLPGNPVSAMVCGEIFLRPALEASMGLPAAPRAETEALLTHDLEANGPREHYMRAVLEDDRTVTVMSKQDSSLVATLASANALVIRPPQATATRRGEPVRCIVL
ncbi:MAG: gephyrin-like molybdotransferase Glp [Pseudomonadota bacterium]